MQKSCDQLFPQQIQRRIQDLQEPATVGDQ